MTFRNQVRLIVYRIHEKGLEVLLMNGHIKENTFEILRGPDLSDQKLSNDFNTIDLGAGNEGEEMVRTIAIEGDWHDIPRIRSLIRNDLYIVKEKVKVVIPELTEGSFIAIKDAFKRVLPNEYAVLKELKEILMDRNALRNI
ncbi:MAG: hypothetical protein K1X68_10225 [Saprospiraceae bacterium]|nr:hypothetical protein [Saprospiraceae bacterium]HMW39310.1 hypothetical protein [Saprospiraceae bacterium]HMX89478.1 hypothetical protein [Saprospiraceae bacterium]HMZ41127.1 hypothetical protein [Saprospiraceae bacterium]HNB31361.1 hypothetical protein [Saprospiraceae bacterium]